MDKGRSLDYALPAGFYKITSGYLKQITAVSLFIRTSVFLGGREQGESLQTYELSLANNFEVMTNLYPQFLDPYYFCQAFLTPISESAAQQAESIFETGIQANPNDLFLRFFHASNFFLSMDEPLKGAKAFAEAAKLPNAPPMFEHLSAILSAQGGNLIAGLMSLKMLAAGEKDEAIQKRYQEEIVIFEQALLVKKAVDAYKDANESFPESLQMLIPDFLDNLPDLRDHFILIYDSPTIRLQRPDPKKINLKKNPDD
jgi:hypothetical protein